jgi:hypothetical protein
MKPRDSALDKDMSVKAGIVTKWYARRGKGLKERVRKNKRSERMRRGIDVDGRDEMMKDKMDGKWV